MIIQNRVANRGEGGEGFQAIRKQLSYAPGMCMCVHVHVYVWMRVCVCMCVHVYSLVYFLMCCKGYDDEIMSLHVLKVSRRHYLKTNVVLFLPPPPTHTCTHTHTQPCNIGVFLGYPEKDKHRVGVKCKREDILAAESSAGD